MSSSGNGLISASHFLHRLYTKAGSLLAQTVPSHFIQSEKAKLNGFAFPLTRVNPWLVFSTLLLLQLLRQVVLNTNLLNYVELSFEPVRVRFFVLDHGVEHFARAVVAGGLADLC